MSVATKSAATAERSSSLQIGYGLSLTVRDAVRLTSGDQILCPHCEGWHTVRADNVANTEHARGMLFFECRGGRYYAGQIGDESRYQMRASEPFSGLGCPACRQPVAEIELEALGTVVFRPGVQIPMVHRSCGEATLSEQRPPHGDESPETQDRDECVLIADRWLPTAGAINAVPLPLRQYIHDLQTRADPLGDVAELAIARETCRALSLSVEELEPQLAAA